MQHARFENIIALKTDSGEFVGFHSHNLQVARLDEGVWGAISDPVGYREERQELETWNREVDTETRDADIAVKPRSLLINIAQICNLRCDYRAAGGDGTFGEAMKHIDIETIYEQIRM